MAIVKFGSLSISSGETKSFNFYTTIIDVQVALKAFSCHPTASSVSCRVVDVSGSEVKVTASSDPDGQVEVTIIAVVDDY